MLYFDSYLGSERHLVLTEREHLIAGKPGLCVAVSQRLLVFKDKIKKKYCC